MEPRFPTTVFWRHGGGGKPDGVDRAADEDPDVGDDRGYTGVGWQVQLHTKGRDPATKGRPHGHLLAGGQEGRGEGRLGKDNNKNKDKDKDRDENINKNKDRDKIKNKTRTRTKAKAETRT